MLREQVMGAYFRSMAEGMRNHVARGAGAVQRHARRAERDDRAARARRGRTTSTGSCSATATSSPATRGRSTSCSSRWRAGWPRCPGCSRRCRREQRAELQALAEQVLQDMDLAFEVDRLGVEPRVGRSPTCRGASPRWPAARSRCRCRPRSTRWSGCTTSRSSSGRSGATTPAPRSRTWTRTLAPDARRGRGPRTSGG